MEQPVMEAEDEEDEMDGLEVGSEDDETDPFKLPFIAPRPQPNTVKRILNQLGADREEVGQRPNYWTIEKKMEEFKELLGKVDKLNLELAKV